MSRHILVIDDEEAVRDAFLLALEDLDYHIETASSGEDGLQKAHARKPDLVFLDLKMPGLSGVQTLQRLQAVYPDIPVYIVTAFAQEFMAPLLEATQAGLFFQVAQKPLGSREIRIIARSVLDQLQSY
ncbi:MAG: response regulator [Candidatus Competibacteraceae bacterium]|nr:response regulator [Candidatus Competibacteraceae bacterium]